jgi:hypothetical protein
LRAIAFRTTADVPINLYAVTLTDLNWPDMLTFGGGGLLALVVIARLLLRG